MCGDAWSPIKSGQWSVRVGDHYRRTVAKTKMILVEGAQVGAIDRNRP